MLRSAGLCFLSGRQGMVFRPSHWGQLGEAGLHSIAPFSRAPLQPNTGTRCAREVQRGAMQRARRLAPRSTVGLLVAWPKPRPGGVWHACGSAPILTPVHSFWLLRLPPAGDHPHNPRWTTWSLTSQSNPEGHRMVTGMIITLAQTLSSILTGISKFTSALV